MPSYAITGASRGLGFAFVKHFAALPSSVVFAIVRNPTSSPALTEFVQSNPNVHIVKADVTSPEQLNAAAAEISSINNGKLDVLIENAADVFDDAAGLSLLDLVDNPEKADLFEKSLNGAVTKNVMSVVHTTSAFLKLVQNGDLKKIAVLSTGLADIDFTIKTGFPVHIPYSISKLAVNMIVGKYAVSTKQDGITIVAISPGLVNTSTKEPTEEDIKSYLAMVENFKKIKPEYEGAITPKKSIEMMVNVIDGLTVNDSGRFISHNGNQDWL